LLGVPIILSGTKIDRYYFPDSVVRFFDPGSADDLASAMLEMITNEEKRKSLSTKASEFVRGFSWDVNKEKYLNLVDCLIQSS
jgi:glycosyltransferase involved in cell wall biosynthesis